MTSKQEKEREHLGVLKVLKIARSKLVADFLKRDPLIFLSLFKYENNANLINISLENYFISWINYHFHIWEKYINQTSEKMFLKTMDLFLRKYLADTKKKALTNFEFVTDLLNKKLSVLHNLMDVEDKDTYRNNRMIMEYEKDKALFRREINRLMEES